uniref:Pyrroline-5-carboxylate reductase n=1 Tax=Syphacia muris TaxID=451379 RepID=A0A0N5AFV3_9BILA
MKIGFIGAGKMAQALCRGLINSGRIKPDQIIASSPKVDIHLLEQVQRFGVTTATDNTEVVRNANVIFIATKPPVVSKVAAEIAPIVERDKHLIVSVAMGIPIRNIESLLPAKSRVIRVMPNTPAVVLAAASAYSVGASCKEGDSELVKELLSTVGYAVEVPEVMMDPVTGLSGSGPSYVFTIIEGMADGGVKMGMPRDLALKLSAHTLYGAAKMVLECGKHPAELRDDVQSPGGSSAYGMHKLESGGLKGLLIDAVEAASLRSKATGEKAASRVPSYRTTEMWES